MELSSLKQKIRDHFDSLAETRKRWRRKNAYYYRAQSAYLKFLIPEGKRVLELGCGTGELLADLKPAHGVGIDFSERMIAEARAEHPGLTFTTADIERPETWGVDGTFDYVVMSDTVGHLEDIQTAFEAIRTVCTPETRIIISYYNQLWQPILKFGEVLGMKMPAKLDNWLTPDDVEHFLYLADFETVKKDRRLLLPKKIPLLSGLVEFVGALPLVNSLCLSHYVVARMKDRSRYVHDKSVTVVIPTRNEKGNIQAAVDRTPDMGPHTEIIFIDGHSEDGTPEEIERVMAASDRDIKFLVQDGKGKGDAVRKAFDHASCDVLMILDADLTVPPEELPKFYAALVSDKGEYINGSRLVYPMEDEAMRFLNHLGNKFFSKMFSWLLNQRITDTLCGTKVLTREHYRELAANRSYFGDFDPFGDFDLIFGASKMNLRMVDVPIRYRARVYGETQISRFRHGLLLLRMCAFAARRLKLVGRG